MKHWLNCLWILFLIEISFSCGVHKETKQIYKQDGSLYATETNKSSLIKARKINESELVMYETPAACLFFEKKSILRIIGNSDDQTKFESQISKDQIISLNSDFSMNGLTQKINVYDLIDLIKRGKVRIQIKENKRFVTVFQLEEKIINEAACVSIRNEDGLVLFEYEGCSYPIVEYP